MRREFSNGIGQAVLLKRDSTFQEVITEMTWVSSVAVFSCMDDIDEFSS
jgi:hypothetical protein